MLSLKAFLVALFVAAAALPASAQSPQLDAGQVWGNSTAAARPARAENVTAIFDRALGSTRGSIIERGASSWVTIGPSATVRAPFVSSGTGADPAYLGYSLPASLTAGGVVCATSTSALASGNLLTANALLIGGGSSACPTALGSLGTTTTVLHGNAGGAPTFAATVSADLNITTTSCTNQVVTAISATATGTCSSVAYAMIASSSLATGANLEAGAASVLLSAAVIYDGEQTITFAGTQTWDFNTFLNARETLTANITSLTCSNIKASQSGVISLVQDGTGSRTMVAGWCSQFRWAGGVRGVLTTTASAIDSLFYQCVSTSICYVSLSKAQAN